MFLLLSKVFNTSLHSFIVSYSILWILLSKLSLKPLTLLFCLFPKMMPWIYRLCINTSNLKNQLIFWHWHSFPWTRPEGWQPISFPITVIPPASLGVQHCVWPVLLVFLGSLFLSCNISIHKNSGRDWSNLTLLKFHVASFSHLSSCVFCWMLV